MPLLGKIVVIKRNGTDGTEFPLTASCLFGRKLDCDIRIQLPQVSKEHCRIELNENKELILTNLSSVNPTRINGEVLQQTERLKHGDLITIIDRSFRFEYPSAPTPKKKRLSTPGKGDAVKVLQHQQVRSTPERTDKKKAEHSATCLKDGSNLPPMDQSTADLQSKANTESTSSPFSDLCNMVKRDLASKPWKSATLPNTPVSQIKPPAQEDPKKASSACNAENVKSATPRSAKKRRSSSGSGDAVKTPAEVQIPTPATEKQKSCSGSVGTPVSQKTPQATPQKFTAREVAQQIVFESPSTAETPKSPKSRRNSASRVAPENQATPQKMPADSNEAEEKRATRSSPRASAGKRFQVDDVVREMVSARDGGVEDNLRVTCKKHKSNDLPLPAAKRKRVSFGGQLSPELFDKRLPPDSPLRRGATPGRRSLGFFQKPQSLLRRASTIGLMGFQLHQGISEIPNSSASKKRASSPAKAANVPKTPSPAKKSPKTAPNPKTPYPAKKSPKTAPTPKTLSPAKKSPKTAPTPKTPSPAKKSPRARSPKSPKTPLRTPCPSEGSLLQTPTMHGRFSVSRISTPSPVSDQDRDASIPVAEEPPKAVTPKNLVRRRRRSSRRASAKSALNSVVRSRRSGASLANLKVLSSWADVVKFGQVKSQAEAGAKKTAAKQKAAKQPKVQKLKTPARRLKDHTSTGHADSPATIVVGKAYLRAAQNVGAAPKVVFNVALRKEDMNMDEDLTGVSDIFKTPAAVKRGARKGGESPGSPFSAGALAEMSGMNTPEESGEMVVSPLSVASHAKRGRFNAEAVSRLLQDDRDGSLIEKYDPSEMDQSDSSGVAAGLETQLDEEEPEPPAHTPKRKPEPAECLTGIKMLMRTPKLRASPVEDLRGKLLRTPRGPKPPQEVSLEGVKELLKTPKRKESPIEDLSGIKEMMKTPKVKNSPVVRSVAREKLVKTLRGKVEQEEDLTGLKELMKTPKIKATPVDDSFGVKRLMKTPKQKHEPVEDLVGIKELMKTPKQKHEPVEDLVGIKELMKTPKQKHEPIEDLSDIKEIKTPTIQKSVPVAHLTGLKEMVKTPKQKIKPVEDLTGLKEMKTPKQKIKPVEDLTGLKEMMKTPKQKIKPVEDLTGLKEMMKTPKEKSQPVEDDFEISTLMKTPKQSAGVVLESSHHDEPAVETGAQSEPSASPEIHDHLAASAEALEEKMQVSEESEDKENVCPSEVLKTDTQSVPQSDVVEEPNAPQADPEPAVVEDLVEEPVIAAAVASVPSSLPLGGRRNKGIELVETVQSPARQSARGRMAFVDDESPLRSMPTPARAKRGRKANQESENPSALGLPESAQPQASERTDTPEPPVNEAVDVPKDVVETDDQVEALAEAPVKSGMRSRRGRPTKKTKQDEETLPVNKEIGTKLSETDVPVKSNSKLRRGRGAKKETANAAQANASDAVDPPEESVAESESEVKSSTRSRRVRSTKKEVEQTEATPANETNSKSSEAETPETEAPVKSAARTKSSRGTKKDVQTTVQMEEAPEPTPVIEVSGVKSPEEESAETKLNTRSKRGRATKTEPPKTKAADVNESGIKSPDVVAAVETEAESVESEAHAKSNTKSRRGRATKTETPKSESPVVNEPDFKTSGAETDGLESTELEPAAETEIPVKSGTRSRRGRTPKATKQQEEPVGQAPADEQSDSKIPDAVVEMAVVKPGRGRRAKMVEEPRSVVDPQSMQDPPFARSGRGTKSKPQVVDEPEPASAATEPEEPLLKPTVRGSRRTKKPKAQESEDVQEKVKDDPKNDVQQTEAPAAKSVRGKRAAVVMKEPATLVKRASQRRTPAGETASRGRKAAPEPEPEEVLSAAAAGESVSDVSVSIEPVVKKARGRNAKKAKVSAKDTSGAEESRVDHNPETKGSKKVNWKPELVLSKIVADLTPEPKSSKEEPPVNEVSTDPPSRERRGRAAKKAEPEQAKPSAPETVAPVRRGRAGAAAITEPCEDEPGVKSGQKRKAAEKVEVVAEPSVNRRRGKAASEEETGEEPENDKPVRGRRKGAQQTQPEETDVSVCRGTRGQKTPEPDVSAPVKRSRRK